MSKFINSKDAIASPLLLWQELPTQVSIEETYDLKVWPVTNIFNEGPINFVIPPQPNGMLTSVDIVTKVIIKYKTATDEMRYMSLGIINNFANSLWELVEVRLDDRVDIMQSMRNSYAYQTFFNHALNTESTHADYLFENELFKMDEGFNKAKAENTTGFTLATNTIAKQLDEKIFALEDNADFTGYNYAQKLKALKETLDGNWRYYTTTSSNNPAAGERASRFMTFKDKTTKATVSSKLQCPILTTSKCLPTNVKIRVSLSKNSDDFLLFANSTLYGDVKVIVEDIYLNVTYYRPRDAILKHIEDNLKRESIPYFLSKPEIIIKPITHSNRIIRITNLFHDKMPSQAFFCLQKKCRFQR